MTRRRTVTINTSSEPAKKAARQNYSGSRSIGTVGSLTSLKRNVYKFTVMTQWKAAFGCLCLAVASYFGYLGYLETRVNTPFDNQKMVQQIDDPERFWGSYRPGNYFGLKTRDPYSLVMGLMWYDPQKLGPGGEGIRHWCAIEDKLQKYGWTHHDGRTFGVQEIFDLPFKIETSFIKFPKDQYGDDWSARVFVHSGNPQTSKRISLIWYTALDEKTDGSIWSSTSESIPTSFGETLSLGKFKLSFHQINGTLLHHSSLSTAAPGLQYLRETITSHLRLVKYGKNDIYISLPGDVNSQSNEIKKVNFVATQIVVETPFTLDIAYQSYKDDVIASPIVGNIYTKILGEKLGIFDKKFEDIFGLKKKGFTKTGIGFAKAALSNMIGGIGYFHGSSRVQSDYTKEPVPYWKASLYTGVPSRSFFPRGFLWDEGFHGLLISEWDLDIELDIICHWFDLINVEGWIPREQILGVEALSKVPEEFVTQKNSYANPPTFFLVLKKIITKLKNQLQLKGRLIILDKLYHRLEYWFSWYNTTQIGDVPGTYRWRGRDENSLRELNPKTLTSGLDDYPRASHPNDKERHVDLRCWIGFAAGVMVELSDIIGRDSTKYRETYSYLSDNNLLNILHLSPYTETYSDWGLHTDAVTLKQPKQTNNQASGFQKLEMIRITSKQPEFRFVDSTYGYVSLFPFLLEILETDSPYLLKILKDIRDPNTLWTIFGLRSLSKTSPLYMKRNTEHDPPYWRGQIWININYLALKALHYYASQPGPYSEEAKSIYIELRQNLITNLLKEYKRTGYIWEQYSDSTGEGSGCYPFNGWSALIVLIMSEQY